MDTRREDIPIERIPIALYKRLLALVGDPYAVIRPELPEAARGIRAHDGLFEHDPHRPPEWLVFEEPEDRVFWNMRTGDLARETGRAFALGEAVLTNPGTFMLDGAVELFATPATWLQHQRKGIVVLDWRRAYHVLSFIDAPRITVPQRLAAAFAKSMSESYRPLVEIIED